jgi:putative DNA primase/helicase
MPDGSLLLELVDESGAVAAQTITPQGEKRLLTGSAKRGAYHAVNAPESPQSVLIAEGLATALSVHLMRPEALTVAAIDAGNLLPVAEVMRRKHPKAQIIIAADNDHPTAASKPEPPTGGRRESSFIRGWLGGAAADRP